MSPFTSPTRDQIAKSSPAGRSNLSPIKSPQKYMIDSFKSESPRFGGFFSSSSEASEHTVNRYAKVGDSSGEVSSRLGSVLVSAPAQGPNWALIAIENPHLLLENITLNDRSE